MQLKQPADRLLRQRLPAFQRLRGCGWKDGGSEERVRKTHFGLGRLSYVALIAHILIVPLGREAHAPAEEREEGGGETGELARGLTVTQVRLRF